MAAGGVGDAPVMQVFEEAGLVDRGERAEAHRHGGELPEVWHQPGVRIGGNAVAAGFLTEVGELLLADPALDEGAGVDAGRGVALEIDQVAASVAFRCPEKMVEADFIQGGGRLIAGDVAAHAGRFFVGAHHASDSVPADQGLDPALQGGIARMLFLKVNRDGVHIRRGGVIRQIGAGPTGLVDQPFEQVVSALGAFLFDDRGQGVQPLAGFLRVEIGGMVRHVRVSPDGAPGQPRWLAAGVGSRLEDYRFRETIEPLTVANYRGGRALSQFNTDYSIF